MGGGGYNRYLERGRGCEPLRGPISTDDIFIFLKKKRGGVTFWGLVEIIASSRVVRKMIGYIIIDFQ